MCIRDRDYVLGNKGTPRFQDQETVEEEQAFEAERRGPVREMPQNLRDELNDLQPTRSSVDEDDEDDAMSYFAKLAE